MKPANPWHNTKTKQTGENMKKTLLSSIAVIALASSSLLADSQYEITPTIGEYFPHSGKQLEDKLVYGLKGAYKFNKNWAAELGFDKTADMKDRENGGKTSDNLYTLNAVYNYGKFGAFSPFAMAGAGYQDFGKEADKRKDGGIVNWGMGVKYALTDMVSLRADARQIIGLSKRAPDYIASLGLGISFGDKAAPDAPKAEAQKIEPRQDAKPEEAKPVAKAEPIKIVPLKVNFDTSKSVVKSKYMKEIKDFASFMKANPSYKVEIQGHTDSRGSKKLNEKLSLSRAEAIKVALVKSGISADRITARGYAAEKPEVANDTKEHMAENRRSLAVVSE
jgi:OOP family OmpA-OmpF porin